MLPVSPINAPHFLSSPHQITYFSLWYFNKQNQQRWIDLEKPLKKQLDKYGLEPTVYFGVVFYVPSVGQLQQEITRSDIRLTQRDTRHSFRLLLMPKCCLHVFLG